MTSVQMSKPKPNQFDVRYRHGHGYAVFGPDGRQVSVWKVSRDEALTIRDNKQREADARSKRGSRACMCCGATFTSDGIHNRLCRPCGARASA